jgi:regulatory protein
MPRPAAPKSAEAALAALMERCARAEVCIADARRSMLRWGVAPEEQAAVIDRLIDERFIDQERYATAYVRDKLNFSRWGAQKIAAALRQKQIPADIVQRAMAQLETVSMPDRLETDLRRKNQSIKELNPYKRKEKLLRFGLARGYDFETVRQTIEQVVGAGEEDFFNLQ